MDKTLVLTIQSYPNQANGADIETFAQQILNSLT